MISTKLILLAGTAVAVLGSTAGASAGTIYGGGSSLASLYMRQAGDCYAAKETLMNAASVTAPVALPIATAPGTVTEPDFVYTSSVSPFGTVFDCGVSDGPEPNGNVSYISTGSGRGLDGFLAHDGRVFGPNANFPSSGTAITFAASDSPMTSAETTAYASGGTTSVTDITTNAPLVIAAPGLKSGFGAQIQLPLFIATAAIAYNPVYAGTFKLHVKTPNKAAVAPAKTLVATGGLPMTKAIYCGIFNGSITNWNDPALTAANGGLSLKDPTDPTPVGSWSAPITKIFARADGSGTTQIGTRHLANVCNAAHGYAGTNNYTNLAGTSKLPAAAISALGATLSLGNGSGSVKTGVEATPGSLGIIGAEFLSPFNPTGSALNAANLQIGTGTTFAAVGIATATTAFGSLTSGSPAFALPAAAAQQNPLNWVPTNLNSQVADPSLGYPMFGTTNVNTYTCYADPTDAQTLKGFLQVVYGVYSTVRYDNAAFVPTPPAINSPAAVAFAKVWTDTKTGLVALAGLAPMPATWQSAINKSFLTDPKAEVTAFKANPAVLTISGVTAAGKKTPGIGVANGNCFGLAGA